MKTAKATLGRKRARIEKWVLCSVRWFFYDGSSKYSRYTTTKCEGVTFEKLVENQVKFLAEDVRLDDKVTGAKLISVDGVRVNRTV